jgi:hypothetical protein
LVGYQKNPIRSLCVTRQLDGGPNALCLFGIARTEYVCCFDDIPQTHNYTDDDKFVATWYHMNSYINRGKNPNSVIFQYDSGILYFAWKCGVLCERPVKCIQFEIGKLPKVRYETGTKETADNETIAICKETIEQLPAEFHVVLNLYFKSD